VSGSNDLALTRGRRDAAIASPLAAMRCPAGAAACWMGPLASSTGARRRAPRQPPLQHSWQATAEDFESAAYLPLPETCLPAVSHRDTGLDHDPNSSTAAKQPSPFTPEEQRAAGLLAAFALHSLPWHLSLAARPRMPMLPHSGHDLAGGRQGALCSNHLPRLCHPVPRAASQMTAAIGISTPLRDSH
jgi:hypothetical protein